MRDASGSYAFESKLAEVISTLNAVTFAHETWTLRRWLIHWLAVFSIWTWGKTIDFKAALKAELPGKRNTPLVLVSSICNPSHEQMCSALKSWTRPLSLLPCFWTQPKLALAVLSHQIKFTDNLQLSFHCKFRQLGWGYPHPTSLLSTRSWTNTPSLSLTLCWRHWTLTLLGLSLWGSNTLSQRRRPVSCLSCCR